MSKNLVEYIKKKVWWKLHFKLMGFQDVCSALNLAILLPEPKTWSTYSSKASYFLFSFLHFTAEQTSELALDISGSTHCCYVKHRTTGWPTVKCENPQTTTDKTPCFVPTFKKNLADEQHHQQNYRNEYGAKLKLKCIHRNKLQNLILKANRENENIQTTLQSRRVTSVSM